MTRGKAGKAMLALMLAAVLAAALLCARETRRRDDLRRAGEALQTERYEVSDGERGYNTVVAAKNRYEEERDNLNAEIQKISAEIADMESDTAKIRKNLDVIAGYREHEAKANAGAALYRAALDLLTAHPEALPETEALIAQVKAGELSAEDALAQLPSFGDMP